MTRESVRRQLAREFGCDAEELAITRNASESLQIAQLGIDLKPGDEVLTTDQDYPRMLTTWEQRVRREGIVLKQISFKVPPPSDDYIVDQFGIDVSRPLITQVSRFDPWKDPLGVIEVYQKLKEEFRQRDSQPVGRVPASRWALGLGP